MFNINFKKKVNLTKELDVIITKIEKNKIILMYFDLVMNLEYELDSDLMISTLNF